MIPRFKLPVVGMRRHNLRVSNLTGSNHWHNLNVEVNLASEFSESGPGLSNVFHFKLCRDALDWNGPVLPSLPRSTHVLAPASMFTMADSDSDVLVVDSALHCLMLRVAEVVPRLALRQE